MTDIPLDDTQLDLLAYDIADTLDRGEYGMGGITQDHIRDALPAFLRRCLGAAKLDERKARTNAALREGGWYPLDIAPHDGTIIWFSCQGCGNQWTAWLKAGEAISTVRSPCARCGAGEVFSWS